MPNNYEVIVQYFTHKTKNIHLWITRLRSPVDIIRICIILHPGISVATRKVLNIWLGGHETSDEKVLIQELQQAFKDPELALQQDFIGGRDNI